MNQKKKDRINKAEIIAKNFCLDKNYKFVDFIGAGGNGTVFKISKLNKEFALKIVLPTGRKDQLRYDAEIKTMIKYQGKGIIQIIDSGVINNYRFYLMPCLTPLDKYEFESIEDVIKSITRIANILNDLANDSVFHRDLKPGNIVIDSNTKDLYLIDLGLVKNPNIPINVTVTNEKMGSFSFMSPERINTINAKTIDNEKSDIYSFGMVAWSLITKQKKGFFGTYLRSDAKNSFSSFNIDFRGRTIIENLLTSCTLMNPEQRPSFSEITDILNNFKNNNLEIKDFYSDSIFSLEENTPDYLIWTDIEDISNVLQRVIKRRFGLEILLPNGSGWLNLEKIKKSEFYPDFLEISANSDLEPPFLLAPNYLFLAMFEDHPLYILEAKKFPKLHKAMPYDDESIEWQQTLTHLSPYNFTYEQCALNNDYNGKDIPIGSAIFTFINEGRFLLHPIDHEKNNSQLIENIWKNNNDVFDIKYPSYEEQVVENIDKYIFHEVTSFKSKLELLQQNQIDEIQQLIIYIFENKTDDDRIPNELVISYCKKNKNPNLLLDYIEAAHELSLYDYPFYPKLSQILTSAEKSKTEHRLITHPEHSGFRLIRLLYNFIFSYSDNPTINKTKYEEIQKQEELLDQQRQERMQKFIEDFAKRKEK